MIAMCLDGKPMAKVINSSQPIHVSGSMKSPKYFNDISLIKRYFGEYSKENICHNVAYNTP